MLQTLEQLTGPTPAWSIIWLHGLGADGGDFVPVVPELVRRDWPDIRFVFPHAPVRPVTINGGMRMRAWYDIVSADLSGRGEDAAGVRDSLHEIEALIAREVERGISPEHIVLAGFSQGAAIALACGLTQRSGLAAIIALSGYLPLAAEILPEFTPAGLATPVFMAHGSQDPVVVPALGLASRDALRAAGVSVQWHSYPMPHAVCREEITDLSNWLEERFELSRG